MKKIFARAQNQTLFSKVLLWGLTLFAGLEGQPLRNCLMPKHISPILKIHLPQTRWKSERRKWWLFSELALSRWLIQCWQFHKMSVFTYKPLGHNTPWSQFWRVPLLRGSKLERPMGRMMLSHCISQIVPSSGILLYILSIAKESEGISCLKTGIECTVFDVAALGAIVLQFHRIMEP